MEDLRHDAVLKGQQLEQANEFKIQLQARVETQNEELASLQKADELNQSETRKLLKEKSSEIEDLKYHLHVSFFIFRYRSKITC